MSNMVGVYKRCLTWWGCTVPLCESGSDYGLSCSSIRLLEAWYPSDLTTQPGLPNKNITCAGEQHCLTWWGCTVPLCESGSDYGLSCSSIRLLEAWYPSDLTTQPGLPNKNITCAGEQHCLTWWGCTVPLCESGSDCGLSCSSVRLRGLVPIRPDHTARAAKATTSHVHMRNIV